MTSDRRSRAVASLRGLAAGDAIGAAFFVPANRSFLTDRALPPDPWLWTDDTEMACSVVAVLAERGTVADPAGQDALAQSFAAHHDFDRGYGAGVNRMLRLIRQEQADWRVLAREMFDGGGSWGNGAAMRVAPLGAWFADDPRRAASEAAASAEVTHTHPEGVAGAVAVAVAAALAAAPHAAAADAAGGAAVDDPTTETPHSARPRLSGRAFLDEIAELTPPGPVRDGIGHAMALLPLTDPVEAGAVLGNGRYVSAPDTVPFCLWAAAKHLDDLPAAFWATAAAGGDVDTTCAIVGGIVAARTGPAGIPAEWLSRTEPLPSWARIDGAA